MKLCYNTTVYWIVGLIVAISMLIACDSNLQQSLDMAGDNRDELEKVLSHFKDNPDPLKYRVAKFLIENMPFHYSYEGKGIQLYDSVYLAMSEEPIQFRDSVFKQLMENVDSKDMTAVPDIRWLKADYLIKVIDEACDTWQASLWHNEYDESLFLDYVLPYRLLTEQVSDWKKLVNKEYPTLKSKVIRSKRGIEFEAEQGVISDSEIVSTESASKGEMVVLDKDYSSVRFTINSPLSLKKSLFLRYTAASNDPEVKIIVNGKLICNKRLDPTNTMKVFRDSRTGVDIELKSGENEIVIEHSKGTVGLDYIRLSAVEPFEESKAEDFSKNIYRIKNNCSGNYIAFDTLSQNALGDISLRSIEKNDSSMMVRLDNRGNGSWSISPAKSDSIEYCLEVKYCSLKENDPISRYNFLNANHQKWIFFPIGDGLYRIMSKDSGLFLESSFDEDGKERIIQTSYAGRDSQKWKPEICGVNTNPNTLYTFGSAISEALKVFDVTNQFEWYAFKGNVPPKASSLLKGRTGNCRDEASYTVYLCRYLGIPAAVDFTPNWGNRSQGHSWSVIVTPDGKSIPFYMGCVPGDTAHYYHGYIKPKIFRHGYRLNREIAKDLKDEKSIPQLFHNADFTDVTDEYYTTTDVTRSIPSDLKDRNVAYICVFDNSKWVPVHYGNIRNGKVTFKSMGRNIVYMAGTFEDGKIVPFGSPFLIEADGKIRDIEADTTSKQRLTILRKYPFFGRHDHFNIRMSGGHFQGSNVADFSKKTDLYTHEGLTDGNWYDVKIAVDTAYRYVRYIGPNGSYCNVNEIEFFSPEGEKLTGDIIGSQGIAGKIKEKVFDGDILTGFHGESPDGHWVGVKFSKPTRISRIRYIPRNDGNCIEIGDEYELLYWHDKEWTSLGKKKASENQLVYDTIPSGGLYVIRNLTKGKEERIFTYENEKQIWW
ncbi:MAG: RICIN domain-containing protein [Muribaculaceae bacterium]|nr:RICIN domain-containing protein [Muribaculaceae bacterium]